MAKGRHLRVTWNGHGRHGRETVPQRRQSARILSGSRAVNTVVPTPPRSPARLGRLRSKLHPGSIKDAGRRSRSTARYFPAVACAFRYITSCAAGPDNMHPSQPPIRRAEVNRRPPFFRLDAVHHIPCDSNHCRYFANWSLSSLSSGLRAAAFVRAASASLSMPASFPGDPISQ